jgi:exodeoxyribonuclease VII large subunit
VRVQGETCGKEVANAIRGFNALDGSQGIARPDVLIVARGGGSLEDLWGFNEEAVARAAAESMIPLISAVGHETDWTLIDHAADVRAPTPTGAAEIVVPVKAELVLTVDDLARRLTASALRGVETRRRDLRALIRALPQPDALLTTPRQRLDQASLRLAQALTRGTMPSAGNWIGWRADSPTPHHPGTFRATPGCSRPKRQAHPRPRSAPPAAERPPGQSWQPGFTACRSAAGGRGQA